MPIAPQQVGTATFGESNGVVQTTLTIPKPSGVQTGDILVAVLRCGSSGQTTDYTLAGWQRYGLAFNASSGVERVTGLYMHYVSDANAEPSSYVFALTGNAFARQSGLMTIWRPGVGALPWGAMPTIATSGTYNGGPPPYAPSGTLTVTPNSAVLYASGNETTSGNAATFTPPSGSTKVGEHGSMTSQADTTVTRSVCGLAYEIVAGTSAGGSGKTHVYPAYSSAIAIIAAIPGTEPISSTPVTKFSSVSQFLATKGATAIHRAPAGLASSNLDTLAKAVTAGFSAFEMSVMFDNANVPFLAHPNGSAPGYIDQMVLGTGTTTIDPSLSSFASLSGSYQSVGGSNGPQPLATLAAALAATVGAGLGIALVDPKFGFANSAKVNALLNVCDANGGPTKILIKFDSPTADTTLTTAARSRGYTCVNYWGSDTASLATQQSNWDVLGMAYDGGGVAWAAVKGYGKKTWAAIVPNQAALNQAVIDCGADFYMVQSLAITPVGPILTNMTIADLEYTKLKASVNPPSPRSIMDLRRAAHTSGEYAWWSGLSGLTPAPLYSLTDHYRKVMATALTLTDAQAALLSTADLEARYWAL